jgi:hypothetical protein
MENAMSIKVLGCPDKEFTPYVKRAAQYYSNCLLTKKMQDNLKIVIKFNKKIKDCGSAEVVGYNSSNKAREFLINIHAGLSARDILETLAHEMVHVKQFAYNHTDETLSRWKNNLVSDDLDYWYQPWEIEAHGLEGGLLTKFVVSEKLWNVFEGLRDPSEPIKNTKIKWKKRKITK